LKTNLDIDPIFDFRLLQLIAESKVVGCVSVV
jgi:hypothetical protein